MTAGIDGSSRGRPGMGAAPGPAPPGAVRVLVVLLLAIAVWDVATLRAGTNWGDDFAQFVLHAQNLAHGAPYGQLPFLTEVKNVRPSTYPPVFPLMLAPVVRVWGIALTPLKLVPLAAFIAALAAIWLAFRRDLSSTARLLLVATIGFNPFFWDFKDNILADFPLLLASMAALLVSDTLAARERDWRSGWRGGVLLGVLIYGAYGARTLGGLLLPAIVLESLWRRRRITPVVWTATAVFVLLAVVQERLVPSTGAYLGFYGQYRMGLVMMWRTLLFYVKVLTMLWDTGGGAGPRSVMLIVAAILAAIGGVDQVRRRVRVFEWFALVYMLAMVLWPGWQGLRYLFPVVPIFLGYVFGGIEAVGRSQGPRAARVCLCALLGGTVVTYGLRYTTIDIRGPLDTATPQAQAFFRFIRTGTPADAVIEFPRPRALALFGGRRTFEYLTQEETDGSFQDDLRRGRVTYLTVSSWDGPPWRAFIDRHGACWDRVFDNTAYQVYRVRPGGDSGDPACPARQF